jgi:S-DNA-T family DNA segregation ATPase FtsK/SpoIIIE
MDELRSLASERRAVRESLIASTGSAFLPHVIVVVQPPLRLPAREVVGLLEEAGQIGVSVLWFAEERIALPPPVRIVVEDAAGGATVTHAAGGKQLHGIALDRTTLERATKAALALAPLVDSAKELAGGAIPERVDLVDLLDPQPLTGEAVAERWGHAPSSLRAVIGAGAGQPVAIDIVKDGPHGLIAGTTGSGKSELLQTLVASLATSFPPDRVNFVLIDYKGGAAFKDCVGLPHTVGFVTDLDERLAERAIVSLNAELRWRERVLKGDGFKDLAEMRQKAPADTPPNLILIVDEFAALKNEVPNFIDGIVDIAQRGRSLGVHLLLATQKPRGVISANIQANTNLRIALRVTDTEESTDVLGRPDAARLSRHQPGRAFVRTEATEVTEVQVAYVGAGGSGQAVATPVRTFRLTAELAAAMRRSPGTGPSHLTQMVAAAMEAAKALGIPEQRRPWLPALPEAVELQSLTPPGQLEAPDAQIGLADDAEHQEQSPFVLDLNHTGSAVVFGSAGTGKTTLLRTLAASLATAYLPDQVHVYGLDFAGRGLAPIGRLPHCGDVVYGDDLDRVRRLISMLAAEADERRVRLSRVGASSAAEYRRLTGELMPAIVSLVDGFSQVWDTLEPLDRGMHLDTLTHLISEGRSAGLHFLLTADRRAALPSSLSSTIPRRLLLRLATADEYSALGIRNPKGFEKTPAGRCWSDQGEAQIAALGDQGDMTGAGQARALARLADRLGPFEPQGLPDPVRLLPDYVALNDLASPVPGDRHIPIGLDEQHLATALVDFGRLPSFLVVGPPSGGKTTALRTLVVGLRAAFPELEAILLGTRRSPLSEEPWWTATARNTADLEALTGQIAGQLAEREAAPPPVPLLIVIDDADTLTEGRVGPALDGIVNKARDANAIVLAAMSTYRAARSFSGWAQVLRQQRSGFILQPDEETDGDVFQVRLPRRAGMAAPPGRGYLIQANTITLVQVAE